MPTGYTSHIADGVSFEEFIMYCARAMGACIMMRDEPWDAPIPEKFEPDDYHVKKIQEAQADLDKYKIMKNSDAEIEAQIEWENKINDFKKSINNKNELRNKYEVMLSKVEAWQIPSPEHQNFKHFMVDQITESIKYDCDISYYIDNPPTLLTGEQYLNNKIVQATKDIIYHQAEYEQECKRMKDRNRWLKQLRESLGLTK